ncbi:hypothetical protein CEXT_304111 [Caerostris extrusa]|uniref:Uncharacterized protein n=1 Tax=Caerostris extrusa TaxID=172846 RepID=A0AAV4MFM3_CAEEX|nr:hypothetical protein CEXT_304111 [Caerostris extrusa]
MSHVSEWGGGGTDVRKRNNLDSKAQYPRLKYDVPKRTWEIAWWALRSSLSGRWIMTGGNLGMASAVIFQSCMTALSASRGSNWLARRTSPVPSMDTSLPQ